MKIPRMQITVRMFEMSHCQCLRFHRGVLHRFILEVELYLFGNTFRTGKF